MDAVTTQPGFLQRLRLTAEGWVRQMLAPIDVPYGSSTFLQVQQPFPARRALGAIASNPWVRACIRAKCDDVGGLPLIAVTGRGKTDQLDDHPFLRVMRRPSPGMTETRLRRQLIADIGTTGNVVAWLRRVDGGYEVHRLHPELVKPDIRNGVITRWTTSGGQHLSPLEVFHTADVTIAEDATGVWGESPIRTLWNGLQAVRNAREFAAKQAARGRPDMVFSFPKDSGLGPDAATKISQAYARSVANGEPAFTVGGGVSATQATWVPKDVEFRGLDDAVRNETLAVMRVPPTRAGVPQANYAVAKAELRDYWGALVVGELRLLEDMFTAMAHVVGGSYDVTIRHDVSAVEALQTSYDQRQARAGFWVTVMGATPAQAAKFEGFRDAPVGDVAGGDTATRPAKEVDDQPNRQSLTERALGAWLRVAAGRLQGGGADVRDETASLAGVLEVTGLPTAEARELAAAVAPVVCEAAEHAQGDLSELYVFGPQYARAVAGRVRLLEA